MATLSDEPSALFIGKINFDTHTELVVESLSASTDILSEDLKAAHVNDAEVASLSENLLDALMLSITSRVNSECCARLQTSKFKLNNKTCSIDIYQYSSVLNKAEILQILPEIYNLSLSTLVTTDGAKSLLLQSADEFASLIDAKINANRAVVKEL